MGKRAITADDLLRIKYVGNPQVSPQGDQVAYVFTQMDHDKDGYYSSIYVSDLTGEGRAFTAPYIEGKLVKDTAPAWSPDGKSLAFLSNRTGKNQVWALDMSGGEAKRLTNVKEGVLDFSWSPNGNSLALVIKAEEDQETPELLTDAAGSHKDKKEEARSDVKVITRLRYKMDGAGIFDEKRRQVYLFDLETKNYTRLSNGKFDFGQPQFSPDGQSVIYIGSNEEKQEWEYIPSLYKFDLASGQETELYKGKGSIASPSYSPDGKWIAFAGHERGAFSSGNTQVYVVPGEGGEAKSLSSEFDYTVGNLVGVDAKYDTAALSLKWNSFSTEVYFIATVGGDVQLFKADLEGNVSEALTRKVASVSSYDLVGDHKAAVVLATPFSSGDLMLQDLNDVHNINQLTHWNKELLEEEVQLSAPESFTYKSTDGWEIDGWIIKPYKFNADKTYPMILQIHGGPHTAYGNGLHHEMQLMAAKGYVVLYTNPRGSHGYGDEFVRAVVGDYSGMDYEDIMAGVDYAVEKFSFIDQNQLFVTGGSYGGYMTNVIVTRTDRFKAAVTQRSICNWLSFYGTSDIGFFFTYAQHGKANLWDDEEKLLRVSPIRYARNVKTPTLILHSEQDLRCPMEQAEQWYIALRYLGVETKLVRFPDENHELSRSGKPKHRLERLQHLIGWFEDRII
ncbi:S9 family peptidase [Bacillus horti]|uniref:Dipeptidyl aminopeptidase/acylaminoacyl peptidase n=1 Tax=Caldalkalibacillus horti TaxID=77523 RepID=A0ABT9VV24_9BACI|nr:S9 family peptidase [Bacillus horti]MDQ0164475.1 dipeptidyl aminopeptidase/acylaminoacyl peptidase [Bacillus horti]